MLNIHESLCFVKIILLNLIIVIKCFTRWSITYFWMNAEVNGAQNGNSFIKSEVELFFFSKQKCVAVYYDFSTGMT